MTDLEIFDALIKPSVRVPLTEQYGKFRAELVEPEHPECTWTIRNVPVGTIVFKADTLHSAALFNCDRGACKRADYVLVSERNGRTFVVHIELTTSSKTEKEFVEQLRGSTCLVEYCRAVGREFWRQGDFLRSCEHRYVAVSRMNIAKSPTRFEGPVRLHDRPETPLKLANPNDVQFAKLIGN